MNMVVFYAFLIMRLLVQIRSPTPMGMNSAVTILSPHTDTLFYLVIGLPRHFLPIIIISIIIFKIYEDLCFINLRPSLDF